MGAKTTGRGRKWLLACMAVIFLAMTAGVISAGSTQAHAFTQVSFSEKPIAFGSAGQKTYAAGSFHLYWQTVDGGDVLTQHHVMVNVKGISTSGGDALQHDYASTLLPIYGGVSKWYRIWVDGTGCDSDYKNWISLPKQDVRTQEDSIGTGQLRVLEFLVTFKAPAHYIYRNDSENHAEEARMDFYKYDPVTNRNTGVLTLDKIEHAQSDHDVVLSMEINLINAGMVTSTLNDGQGGMYYKIQNANSIVRLDRGKETVALAPDGGTYPGYADQYGLPLPRQDYASRKCCETTLLPIPTKIGYDFRGWQVYECSDRSAGTLGADGRTFTHCATVTPIFVQWVVYKAIWQPKQVTVNYYLNVKSDAAKIYSEKVAYGYPYAISSMAYDRARGGRRCTVHGWYRDASGFTSPWVSGSMLDATTLTNISTYTLDLYAYDTVSVTCYVDGEQVYLDSEVRCMQAFDPESIYLGAMTVTEVAHRVGCSEWHGWYTEAFTDLDGEPAASRRDFESLAEYGACQLDEDTDLYSYNTAQLSYDLTDGAKDIDSKYGEDICSDKGLVRPLGGGLLSTLPSSMTVRYGQMIDFPSIPSMYCRIGRRVRTIFSSPGFYADAAGSGQLWTCSEITSDVVIYKGFTLSVYDGIYMR